MTTAEYIVMGLIILILTTALVMVITDEIRNQLSICEANYDALTNKTQPYPPPPLQG